MIPERQKGPGRETIARERILERIDRALDARRPVAHPGGFPGNTDSMPATHAEVRRFAESLRRAGGEVVHFPSTAEARLWLSDFASAFASAAVSSWVPAPLRPQLPEADARDAGLGVSVALAAAAGSGSLVLDSGEGRGLQLLPPVHLVWVDARFVQPDLGAALEHARARGPLPAVLALHSGPSKSADIGRIVVTGVHGPGRLIAAICEEPFAETSVVRGT